jgi:hypothetical protein
MLSLTNIRVHLGMAAMLPMLRTLQSLVVQLQTDGSYIRDLVAEVDQAIEALRSQYVHKKRGWSFDCFIEWHKLLAM